MSFLPSDDGVARLLDAAASPAAAVAPPTDVLDWLARLRLLEGVPFAYLVPDERLLPAESIRFFFLDRTWTDTAVDGALAAGAGTVRERAHLRARHAALRGAVDAAERRVWSGDHDGPAWGDAAAETVTGFLLRSRAVSGWPLLHVGATRGGEAVRLLRVERLAPAVLLVLVDGVPDEVLIEEPRQGMQLGVDQPDGDTWVVPAAGGAPEVGVPFRPDAPGVVDVAALATALGTPTTAALTLRLAQSPYRQPFSTVPAEPSFTSSLRLADLEATWEEER